MARTKTDKLSHLQADVVKTTVGWMLIARTERGICLLEFGDQRGELRARLADYFPNAEIQTPDHTFAGWIGKITHSIQSPTSALQLPLDVEGTAFQQQVWRALQTIPLGVTKTYSDVAAMIGQPRAVRAVANACGANRVSILIPCHRVIGRNGTLTGYRWGIERKRKLLEAEARSANE